MFLRQKLLQQLIICVYFIQKKKEMNNNLIEPICVNFVTTNLCLIKQGPLKKWIEHSKFAISTQGENTTAVILHKLN